MSGELEITLSSCRICFKEDETVVNRLSRLHKSIIYKIAQIQFIDGENVPPNMCKDCLNRLLEANYFRDLLLEANKTFEHLVNVSSLHEKKKNSPKKTEKASENDQKHILTCDIIQDQPVLDTDDVPEASEEQEVEVLVPDFTGNDQILKVEVIDDGKDEYFCCMCTYSFTSEENLQFHCQSEHTIQPLITDPDTNQCRLCCCHFANEEDLNTHKTCENCFECFATNDALVEHLKTHEFDLVEEQAVEVARQLEQERIEEEDIVEENVIVEKKKPQKPRKISQTTGIKRKIDRNDLNTLQRVPNTFPCCICPTILTSESERANHMFEYHEIPSDTKFDPTFRNCVYCNRQFERLDQFYGHFEVPIRKQNRCTKCGRNFLTPELLSQHDQNIHSTDTPSYNCQACKISFNTANAYYSHNHRHHTTKPKYKCDICGDMLITPSKLKEHRNVHLNIKDFVCNICNKTFIRKDNLRNHLRTHTGDKPYKCEYCNRCFGHYTDMKRHKYIHTGDYPFKCTVCGKGFVKQSALDTHIKFLKGKPHVNKLRTNREQVISISDNLDDLTENAEISEIKDSYQIVLVDQDTEMPVDDNET